MKMLFFSSERAAVEQVRAQLLNAGIPCEMRVHGATGNSAPHRSDVELWIENDADAHRAALVCVECGVGFAKRPPGVREEEAQGC